MLVLVESRLHIKIKALRRTWVPLDAISDQDSRAPRPKGWIPLFDQGRGEVGRRRCAQPEVDIVRGVGARHLRTLEGKHGDLPCRDRTSWAPGVLEGSERRAPVQDSRGALLRGPSLFQFREVLGVPRGPGRRLEALERRGEVVPAGNHLGLRRIRPPSEGRGQGRPRYTETSSQAARLWGITLQRNRCQLPQAACEAHNLLWPVRNLQNLAKDRGFQLDGAMPLVAMLRVRPRWESLNFLSESWH